MILKKLIGQILSDMGLVTTGQLAEAIKSQRKIYRENILPEQLQRTSLVSKARKKRDTYKAPLLGQILTDMGFVTNVQLEDALKEQYKTFEIYDSLDSWKLGIAIEVGSMINSTLNLAEVLTLIMRHVNRVTDSEASTLMLLDDQTEELVFSVPTGPKADQLTDIRIPPGKGIAGWVVEHEQLALIPDAAKDQRFYSEIDKVSGLETKTILCVPLKAKAKLIGVLEVINKIDGTSFTEEDALFLSIFASQAAMAIENARLYGELEDRLEDAKQMQKTLAKSEKFEALGQMASGVAHDFNNILSAIMGYAEIAQYDIPEKNQVTQSIEQVLKASHRAKDLVSQILAFSRQSEQERIPVQVHQIVEEALKLLRASMPTTIEIRQDIATNGSAILADPTQIHQILMNLCTNAHHAMREKGGILEVNVSNMEVGGNELATYPNLKPGPYIKLSISDTGDGMDQSTLERIFDPYFTTKEKGVGTGMGLAVVHGIVKSHDGAITVSSEQGRGTTFNVLFPRVQKDIEHEAEAFEPLPSGNERILFVDDEKALADLGKQMLGRLGYKVFTRTSSIEALEAFRADPHKFDLIITDMTMPNMTGDVLAEEIMAIRPDIPIMLCTGFSERITKENAKKIGIREFAMKPLIMGNLARTIRKVLDQDKSI
ncbi:MAG: response regulator [Deltaproteobacteria bacterium]|nr:response regulator [Deltaproteobacteria bacterium]